jgi:hypothetical protein
MEKEEFAGGPFVTVRFIGSCRSYTESNRVIFISGFVFPSLAYLCVLCVKRVVLMLVEIAGVGVQISDQRGVIREAFRDQMSDSAFSFENAIHAQQSCAQ